MPITTVEQTRTNQPMLVTELKSALAKRLKSDASIDKDPTCMRVR